MNKAQRWCLAGGLVLVAAVIAVIVLRVPDEIARWVKSLSAIALFVAAVAVPKRVAPQRLIAVAFGLSAVGDLFFTGILPAPGGARAMSGIVLFLVAYLFVVAALWRGRVRPGDLAWVVPYAALAAVLLVVVAPATTGVLVVAVAVFALVIVTMAWTAAVMRRRGHFSADVSRWAALGAAVLFVSDALVAVVLFTPELIVAPTEVDAFIRATYVLGWVLLLLLVADDTPLRVSLGASAG